MSELNIIQVMVTSLAALLLMTPLLVLAFLSGRKSIIRGTSRRFDILRSEIVLHAGSWQVEFDSDNPNDVQVVSLQLDQIGSRIVADGRSSDGTHYSLEGIVYERRVCLICIGENRHQTSVGTVTAELQADQQSLTGMLARWSHEQQMLIIRKATFTRLMPVA